MELIIYKHWVNGDVSHAEMLLGQGISSGVRTVDLATAEGESRGWYFHQPKAPGSNDFPRLQHGRWYHLVYVQRPAPFNEEVTTGFPFHPLYYIDGVIHQGTLITLTQTFTELWREFGNNEFAQGLKADIALLRVWRRSLTHEEVRELYKNPYAMFDKRFSLVTHAQTVFTIPAATMAQTTVVQGLVVPAQMQWQAQQVILPRFVVSQPSKMAWRAQRLSGPLGLVTRECPEEYETALAQPFIAGDWLVRGTPLSIACSTSLILK
jgi:hypothetical protein